MFQVLPNQLRAYTALRFQRGLPLRRPAAKRPCCLALVYAGVSHVSMGATKSVFIYETIEPLYILVTLHLGVKSADRKQAGAFFAHVASRKAISQLHQFFAPGKLL